MSKNAFKAAGAKPRLFKAPKVSKPPTDLAELLDYSADRADEIGLAADGLVGGTAMLRKAAAEIRNLRTRLSTIPNVDELVVRLQKSLRRAQIGLRGSSNHGCTVEIKLPGSGLGPAAMALQGLLKEIKQKASQ